MASHDFYKRLQAEMSEDGCSLHYLPTNQAYLVTFGHDGPRVKGPAPLRVISDWWEDLQYDEDSAQEPCYD